MANQADDQKLSKPTFAKVLASSYVPSTTNSIVVSPTPPGEMSQSIPKSIKINVHQQGSIVHSDADNDNTAHDTSGPNSSASNARNSPDSTRVEESTSKAGNDDGSTHISSDDSVKLANFDTKSVASGTTFAMDEKESLRPDDSASMRAIAEDDELVSAPGSVLAGSRVGSDIGAKAFREQLHEIANIKPNRVGNATPENFQGSAIMSASKLPQSGPGETEQISPAINHNRQDDGQLPMTPPDEKLMEALQSPRDRVFVLKLEQDIIDFINQSKEMTLALPKCNGFYRMLAHKLADYYRLDHTVDQTQAGAAVIITRTTFCRLAPPLSGIPNASATSATPVMIQARKIMRRRPDEHRNSETSTAANSEGPSATPSEVGYERDYVTTSPPAGSDVKPKGALSREEREAKYAEVRQRIFGKNDGTTELGEVAGETEESQESRASSASDKRKTLKKHRNLSDDDFEPRSQFYGASPISNGFPSDQYYYQNFTSPTSPQYPTPPNAAPSMNYINGYHTMVSPDAQPQYGWQTTQMQMPLSSGMSYPQGVQGGYDLSAHFNTGMQSFQNSAPSGSIPAKQQGSSPYTHAQQTHQHSLQQSQQQHQQPRQLNQMHQVQWPQQYAYDQGQQYRAANQQPNGYTVQAQGAYNYGQYPMTMPNAPMQGMPYLPSNAPRPQFNPQIQSFIPGNGPNRPMSLPSGVHPPYGMAQPMQMAPGMQMPLGAVPRMSHQVQAPRPGSTTTPIPHNTSLITSSTQQHSSGASASSSPPVSSPNSKPVPEITAKWGTPAHLPRKPPPPESMEPHKYMEINKGLPQYPGLPRINTNGYNNNGFNGNANNRFGS